MNRCEQKFGVRLPTTVGKDTLACMEAANECEIKVGFCLGGNLYGSNPDSTFAAEALSRLDMNVMLSTTMNTGHVHGLAERNDHPAGPRPGRGTRTDDAGIDVQLRSAQRRWASSIARSA